MHLFLCAQAQLCCQSTDLRGLFVRACAQVHSSLWIEALGCVEAAQRDSAVVSSPQLAHLRHQREVEHNRGPTGTAVSDTRSARLALDEAEGLRGLSLFPCGARRLCSCHRLSENSDRGCSRVSEYGGRL